MTGTNHDKADQHSSDFPAHSWEQWVAVISIFAVGAYFRGLNAEWFTVSDIELGIALGLMITGMVIGVSCVVYRLDVRWMWLATAFLLSVAPTLKYATLGLSAIF